MDDLIFNELSVQPYPANFDELNQRVKNLVLLCKQAREKFNFKKLRFTRQLHEYKLLTEEFSFSDYIRDKRINPTVRTLLLDLHRYPFIDDEDEQVLAQYLEKQFRFQKGPDKLNCDGLATAYLYDTVAVSFSSEPIWDNLKIPILVQKGDTETSEPVFHISKTEHLEKESELTNWLSEKIQHGINTIADLKRLYPNYVFESSAFDDLLYWKAENQALYFRLHVLLKDIRFNPVTGGLGKTESLKGTGGQASKRLNSEHRIVYSLQGEVVTVYRCKGHYDD
jgi:toxin YoeB